MNEINLYPQKARQTEKLIQDLQLGRSMDFDRSRLTGFINSLNPLQFASETIARLVHYKHQIKLLEFEQKRIDAEAGIMHHKIDATLQAGFQILEVQKTALHIALQAVSEDLENSHFRKKSISESINNLVNNISDKNLSLEEKQLSNSALLMLIDLLKDIGEKDIIKLDSIAKNTLKALEAIPRSGSILLNNGV